MVDGLLHRTHGGIATELGRLADLFPYYERVRVPHRTSRRAPDHTWYGIHGHPNKEAGITRKAGLPYMMLPFYNTIPRPSYGAFKL